MVSVGSWGLGLLRYREYIPFLAIMAAEAPTTHRQRASTTYYKLSGFSYQLLPFCYHFWIIIKDKDSIYKVLPSWLDTVIINEGLMRRQRRTYCFMRS